MPSDPRAAVAAALISPRSWADGLRRSVSTSGTIVTTQKTPTIMWAWRQPMDAIIAWRIGGQIVPAM